MFSYRYTPRLHNQLNYCFQVNAPDADIVFISSDMRRPVRFHIHSKYLEASTGAFPPVLDQSAARRSGLVTSNEPVPLSETAKVLEILFGFIYPRRHSDLEDIPFELLAKVAEAAEKYEVYPAATICKLRMG